MDHDDIMQLIVNTFLFILAALVAFGLYLLLIKV